MNETETQSIMTGQEPVPQLRDLIVAFSSMLKTFLMHTRHEKVGEQLQMFFQAKLNQTSQKNNYFLNY